MNHDAKYYYQQSQEKKKQRDYAGSLADLGEAIRLDPTNTFYLWERGLWLSFREERELAEKDLSRIIELSSDLDELARARYHRSVCYMLLGYREKELEDLNWLIENGKGDAGTYNSRGECYLYFDRLEEALDEFSMAFRLDPRVGQYLWRCAQIRFHFEQYEDAIRDLTDLISVGTFPINTCYVTRSICFYRLHRYAEALDDYNRAREINGERTINDLSDERAFFEGFYFNFQQMRGLSE